MKLSISSEHRRFYQDKGYIEFEELLSEEQRKNLLLSFDGIKVPEHLFSPPRDLWRDQEIFRKIVCQKKFAEIAAGIAEESTIRLCLDQIFELGPKWTVPSPDSLEQLFCFEGLIAGLLFRLSDQIQEEPPPPFPRKPGNGMFFSPKLVIDFESGIEGKFLLICYGKKHSKYILNPKDPHTYELRQFGYIYGSMVKNKYHPILFS